MSVEEVTTHKKHRTFDCKSIQNKLKTLAIFKLHLKAKEVKIT